MLDVLHKRLMHNSSEIKLVLEKALVKSSKRIKDIDELGLCCYYMTEEVWLFVYQSPWGTTTTQLCTIKHMKKDLSMIKQKTS